MVTYSPVVPLSPVNLSVTEMLKVWEIKIDELKFGEALGTGAFGSVCSASPPLQSPICLVMEQARDHLRVVCTRRGYLA